MSAGLGLGQGGPSRHLPSQTYNTKSPGTSERGSPVPRLCHQSPAQGQLEQVLVTPTWQRGQHQDFPCKSLERQCPCQSSCLPWRNKRQADLSLMKGTHLPAPANLGPGYSGLHLAVSFHSASSPSQTDLIQLREEVHEACSSSSSVPEWTEHAEMVCLEKQPQRKVCSQPPLGTEIASCHTQCTWGLPACETYKDNPEFRSKKDFFTPRIKKKKKLFFGVSLTASW